MFPTRSSLVKEPEAFAPAVEAFSSAAKRELTPAGSACQQLFFVPRKFFRSAPPFGFPSGGAEAGIYSASLSLSTVFSTRPDFFSNPAANPSATPRQLEASFYPAPSRAACQQLIFREQKKQPPCRSAVSRGDPHSCNRNFRPAAAKTVYAPLLHSCQLLFCNFFPVSRKRSFQARMLIL